MCSGNVLFLKLCWQDYEPVEAPVCHRLSVEGRQMWGVFHQSAALSGGAQHQVCVVLRQGRSSQAGCWHAGLLGKVPLAFSFPAESDKEEAAEEDGRLGLSVVPRQVTSALSALSVNYGSASDSEPEGV